MALLAAYLGAGLLLCVCGYALGQLRRGDLDPLMLAGLVSNLFGVSVLWLRTDKPVEGRTLVALGQSHGITSADLLTVLPALLVLRLLGQSVRVSARENRR